MILATNATYMHPQVKEKVCLAKQQNAPDSELLA